jgi:hypothetical protein
LIKNYAPSSLTDEVQREQMLSIVEHFLSILIEVKPGKRKGAVFVWELNWCGDKAGLYLHGDNWSVDPLKAGEELSGNWEGFDLDANLDANEIDLDWLAEK